MENKILIQRAKAAVGEQVAGLIKMVGYKTKAPKKAQAKKGKKK